MWWLILGLAGATLWGICTPVMKQGIDQDIGEITLKKFKENPLGLIKTLFFGNKYFLPGLIGSILGWVIWYQGLQLGEASIVGPLGAFSTVITPIYAYFYLDERLSRKEIMGIVLALAGIAVLGLYQGQA